MSEEHVEPRINPRYEARTPDMSTWTGRQPRGLRESNSFKAFVAKSKTFKEGKAHLERHHNGFGL